MNSRQPFRTFPTALAAGGGLVQLQVAASGVVGGAVGLSIWWVYQVLRSDDLQQGAEWRYDISRINELRRLNLFYRIFHPAIQALARMNRAVFRESLPEIQRQIQAAGLPRFWLPEEYLARIEILALFTIPVYSYLFFSWFGGGGLLVALGP